MNKIVHNLSMIKLSKIIDFLGKFITLFFVLLVLFRCLKVSFNFSCLLSVLFSFFILMLMQVIRQFKNKKTNQREEDIKNIEKITEQFKYSSLTQIKRFLMTLFNTKYQKVTTHKFGFSYYNGDEKSLVFLFYNQPKLDINTLINIYRDVLNTKFNAIHIFCFEYDPECLACLARFKKRNFEIYNITALYFNVLKPANKLPNFEIEKIQIPKYTFKSIMQGALTRRKAKSYFWFGMLVFMSSFFVPMSIYYLVFALILFTLSFLSRFVMKSEKLEQKNNTIWQ